jgi:transposase-like protein
MKFSQSEKMEIIRMIEGSDLSVKKTLEKMDEPRSSFYNRYRKYLEQGYDGLKTRSKTPQQI